MNRNRKINRSGDRIKDFRRVAAAELVDNPNNWRTHPQGQRDALKAILDEVGFAGAVLTRKLSNGKLEIIDGHLRKDLVGKSKIPVLITDLTVAESKLILATYDPIGAMAETNAEMLNKILDGIETDSDALKKMLDNLASENPLEPKAGLTGDDAVPEVPVEPTSKTGDLWLLGDHRLLCGDSTKAEDVERLMNGEKAILCATDPPYGVDFKGQKYNPRAKDWEGINGDDRQEQSLTEWLENALKIWLKHIDKKAAFYFWTAAMAEGAAAAAIKGAGIHIQSQIIWNKNTLVLGQADYQWKHENCWYGFIKGEKHNWFGGRDKTTVWGVSKVANQRYLHPMQKPVELYEIPIINHAADNGICFDPFLGSGSQIIAAEKLNRRCYSLEIEPRYVDVSVRRWQDFTGKDAVLEVTKKTFGEIREERKA